jgi:hypothetical protein
MNKNEPWSPELMAQYQRGKVKADARACDLQFSRDYAIRLGISDLQSKLDRYLKPQNATKTAC